MMSMPRKKRVNSSLKMLLLLLANARQPTSGILPKQQGSTHKQKMTFAIILP